MTISVTIGEGILTFSGWIRRRDSAFFTFMPSVSELGAQPETSVAAPKIILPGDLPPGEGGAL
ncbi:hypothetical protein LDY77_01495, partial [Serratia marcescens]|nr:hypothetical protein [Serratia marcescens]